MTVTKRVVALGFFDGVHIGHGALMRRTADRAAELGVEPAVVSFDTHPDTLVKGEAVPLIGSAADREELIERLYGIKSVILIHFNWTMMHTPWNQFADYLRDELGAVHVVVGHDFHFGFKGEGTPERLREYCMENGIGIDVIPAVEIDGTVVSSTIIRRQLLAGDLENANRFLGHPYMLGDTVRAGFRLGRTIGAPTINMRFSEGVLIPRHGVYATKAYFDEQAHMAVTNVGVRPTVGGVDAVTVESHILDYSGDLYGRHVRLEFYAFLRDEVKFADIHELQAQIAQDEEQAREFFAAMK